MGWVGWGGWNKDVLDEKKIKKLTIGRGGDDYSGLESI